MLNLEANDSRAIAVAEATRAGNVTRLKRLLDEDPHLATARTVSRCDSGVTARSLLRVATDWPGHFPNGAGTVAALIAAGADVNADLDAAGDTTSDEAPSATRQLVTEQGATCSFCGTSSEAVGQRVAGLHAFIYDEFVTLCREIQSEEARR